ncbi:MAG TPA: hypothetical protein VIV14_04130 [Gammaproteobacteria bacterium]
MKFLIALLGVSGALVLGQNTASAQQGPLTWAPLEIYGCTFNDGSNMDDLDAVIDTWNEWMDENSQNNYTAIVLMPQYVAGSFAYEVLWVGAWQDSAAIAGMQQWLTEGSEINAEFGEVVTCPLRQGFAVANVKPPAEAEDIAPVAFQNCTIAENRGGLDARIAITEFGEFLSEQGHEGGQWILRPAAGEEADASYSFKWVRSHPSYAALGSYFDIIFNRGGFQRLGELTGNVMSCDSPRVYNARVVREAIPGE